jgi:hypothetical protein
MAEVAYDLLGQEVRLGDLVAYGHSGRYAATRVGRVYWIRSSTSVRVWLFQKTRQAGTWTVAGLWYRANSAEPSGFVKLTEATPGALVPTIPESLFKREEV